jgi:PAS domain-containing protein
MSQKEIEVILTRQLATSLAVPTFIVDPEGTLLFYNEPAELILGRRYEETGEMPAEIWTTAFYPTDEEDRPLPPEILPLMRALAERKPTHGEFWIRGLDKVRRHLDVVAFPLSGQGDRFLGGVALFWELQK